MSNVFIEALLILLREGLEALLVIAALAAYLTKAGAQDRLSALYAGAGAAVLASILAAWMFEVMNNGAHNDIVEGVVILTAAALMLYVSGWLLLRQDPRAWQAYLKERAGAAVERRAVRGRDRAIAVNVECRVARGEVRVVRVGLRLAQRPGPR